jgi:dihydroorotase
VAVNELRTSDAWIDIHAHVSGFARFGIDAEQYGAAQGVGVLVDAGSAPPAELAVLLRDLAGTRTKVLAWANVCAEGIAGNGCDSHDISGRAASRALATAPEGSVVGIKLQASNTRLAERAVTATGNAIAVAQDFHVPLMVHVGNGPPTMREIAPLLRSGDIITHFAHAKPGGALEDGRVHRSLLEAREHGVLFDVGHGSGSFSFEVMQGLIAAGFAPDIISTDLHQASAARPVRSLADCMSKLLGMGMSEDAVVAAVTTAPRAALHLRTSGRLTEYWLGDERWVGEDSYGKERTFSRRFVPVRLKEVSYGPS